MGNKYMQQVQIGQEGTPGTAVVPTALWRGQASIPDDVRTLVMPDEDIGIIPGTDRSYVPALLTEMSFLDTEATFEQVEYPLVSGIKQTSRAQDGAGSGYIGTYDFPTTTLPTVSDITTFSITGGDDQEQEQVEYFFTREFTLAGVAEEALMLQGWSGAGRQSTLDNFESLSAPSVEEILINKMSLYIDDASGSIGSTLISDVIREVSLKAVTGWTHRYSADGNLYFNKCLMTRPELILEVTFDHDTSAIAEKANWRSETSRLIQCNFKGSALDTAGTTYSYKRMIWNLAGKWDRFEPLGEDGGVTVSKGIFKVRYNSTASLYAQILLINELSAIV